MKSENRLTALTGGILAFLIALGTAGSLITAFGLPIRNLPLVVGSWAGFALLSALVFRWKHGGSAMLCLLAFLTGYIWHRGIAGEQLRSLLYRITYVYNSAYGWGVIRMTEDTWNAGAADWPMGILGCLIAVVVCCRVCRRKSCWPAVLGALLPMTACIVVTDTVPDILPLFCLLTGLILLILTASVRQENEEQGLRLTAMAFLPVVIALVSLFLAFPQKDYVNHSQEIRDRILESAEDFPLLVEQAAEKLVSEFQGGAPRQIDLADVGPHVPFSYPVMDITSRTGGTLYLRGQDFDGYTGSGWTSTHLREEPFFLPGETVDSVTIRTRSKKSLYYIPYYPAGELYLAGGTVENPEKEQEYAFSRSFLPEDWRMLTAGVSGDTGVPPELNPYLSLPEYTRRQAEQLTADLSSGTNTEIAHRIGALVCNSARYDLNTGHMPSGEPDFALWFLRSSDTGYCVHYATAATVLLRAAGVPARYVTGYMADTEAGKTVTVTEENAHAWAEYYEPLLGVWMVLEATPAQEQEDTAPPLPPGTQPTENPEPTEHSAASGEPTQEASRETTPSLQLPEPDPVKLTGIARLLVGLAAAIFIAKIQRSTRLQLRRRRQRTGSPSEQALARWREAELLSRLLGESPGEELTVLAQKAKFSRHELTAEELQRFDSYNRGCLRQLRQHPWYRQLIYQYICAIY